MSGPNRWYNMLIAQRSAFNTDPVRICQFTVPFYSGSYTLIILVCVARSRTTQNDDNTVTDSLM